MNAAENLTFQHIFNPRFTFEGEPNNGQNVTVRTLSFQIHKLLVNLYQVF